MAKYCVTCGIPLQGSELRQYCCDQHEADYQEEAARNRQRSIHDQPYGPITHHYNRDTGEAIDYPASKYGGAQKAPPNPYLK